MAAKDIIKLKVRRGTDSQRKLVILEEGEPGFTTDTQRLYIGTGGTNRGGVIAGNIMHPIQSVAGGKSSGTVAARAVKGDLVYEKNKLFQLTQENALAANSWSFVGTQLGSGNPWLLYNGNNELNFNDSAIDSSVSDAIAANFADTQWVVANFCPALTIAVNNTNSCGAFGTKINQITANANDIDDIENSITSIKGFTGYVNPNGGLPAGWGSLKDKIASMNSDLGNVATANWAVSNVRDKIDLMDATISLINAGNGNNNQALTQLINDTASNTAAVDALNSYTSGTDPLPSIPAGWGSLKDKIVDVEGSVGDVESTVAGLTDIILNTIYPVGAIYLTVGNTNPGGWLPGSWSRDAQGRFLAGQGSYTDNNGDNKNFVTGDNSSGLDGTYNHTLTDNQVPKVTGQISIDSWIAPTGAFTTVASNEMADYINNSTAGPINGNTNKVKFDNGGTDQSHNNTPPGFAVYVWKRTS